MDESFLSDIEENFDFEPLQCPLTYAQFDDPVIAEDGHTYNRAAALAWFEVCRSLGRPITSALTGRPMGETLIENLSVKQIVQSRTNTRSAETPLPNEESVPSIHHLGELFLIIDHVRELLLELRWTPPQIIVTGNESTGKSTLMERLCLMPLFPRNQRLGGICTRIIVAVRLRRATASLPSVEICDLDGNPKSGYPTMISPAERLAAAIQQMQNKLVKEENDGHVKGLCTRSMLVVDVTGPHLPNLDIVDTPGIVAAAAEGEPHDMADKSRRLVETYMSRHRKKIALILVTIVCGSQPNHSLGLSIAQDLKLLSKVLGVYTKADECTPSRLRAILQGQTINGAVRLDTHGYLATGLHLPEGFIPANNCRRIYCQARNEILWCKHQGLQDLLSLEVITSKSLLRRLPAIYNHALKTTWLPKTIKLLQRQKEMQSSMETSLGLPRAHTMLHITEDRDVIKDTIAGSVRSALVKLNTAPLFSSVAQTLRRVLGSSYKIVEGYEELLRLLERVSNEVLAIMIEAAQKLPEMYAGAVLSAFAHDINEFRIDRFQLVGNEISRLVSDRVRDISINSERFIQNITSNAETILDLNKSPWIVLHANTNTLELPLQLETVLNTEQISLRLMRPLHDVLISAKTNSVLALEDWKPSRVELFVESCADERTHLLQRIEEVDAAIVALVHESEKYEFDHIRPSHTTTEPVGDVQLQQAPEPLSKFVVSFFSSMGLR